MRPYLVLYHIKFQCHRCRFLLSTMEQAPATSFLLQLYHFKIGFRKFDTDMKNCKFNLGTSGYGKSGSPLVHHIVQLNALVTMIGRLSSRASQYVDVRSLTRRRHHLDL